MFSRKPFESIIKTGKFYCTSCKDRRSFGLAQIRDLLYFFSVPFMPVGKSDHHVFCATCKTKYEVSVLAAELKLTPADIQQAYVDALMKVMAHVLVADDEKHEDEYRMALSLYEELTSSKLSMEEFEKAVGVAEEGEDLFEFLFGLQEYLSDQAKVQIIKAALTIAFSDRLFHKEELALAAKIGSMLGLSADQVHGILLQSKPE